MEGGLAVATDGDRMLTSFLPPGCLIRWDCVVVEVACLYFGPLLALELERASGRAVSVPLKERHSVF